MTTRPLRVFRGGAGGNTVIARAAEAAWLRSLYKETKREQSKHRHMRTVEIVRLTSQGPTSTAFCGTFALRRAPRPRRRCRCHDPDARSLLLTTAVYLAVPHGYEPPALSVPSSSPSRPRINRHRWFTRGEESP
jgi:hypothetical protein